MDEDGHEEKLHQVEEQQDGHKGVAVDVKGVAPLERLLDRMHVLRAQKAVAQPPTRRKRRTIALIGAQRQRWRRVSGVPRQRRDDAADEHKVHTDHRQDQLEDSHDS